MIKGFIEVHDSKDNNNAVLVNARHITEVRGNTIYMNDALPTAIDYDYIKCKEDYLEIAEKIKEAVGDGDA